MWECLLQFHLHHRCRWNKLGVYRKTHIPTGECYEEKFYFTPGNTGFKVFKTKFGNIGVAICWDQWFPECARIMALKGAEMLLYPTAIGSEPVLTKILKTTGNMSCKVMPQLISCLS